jgi:serine/threonine protein kinase
MSTEKESGRISFRVDQEDPKTPPVKSNRRPSVHELADSINEDTGLRFRQLSTTELITSYYSLDTPLYEVGTKSITRCRHIPTGEAFIMKRRDRDPGSEAERHWRQITHQFLAFEPCIYICRLHEVFENETHFYIVMEECSGVQLLDYLLSEQAISHRECKRLMREILQGVMFLHTKGLLHRDIKPENIMFATPEKTSNLKLIDFDTCWEISNTSNTSTPPVGRRRARRMSLSVIGTLGYIAPESFAGEYSTASDLFSVGVIFYILMTGDMPFDDSIYNRRASSVEGTIETVGSPNNKKVYNDLCKSEVDWSINPWPQFPVAKELCQKLLELDAEKRIASAMEVLNHPWFECSK